MRISEMITQYIINELNRSGGIAEIRRNELAENMGCVPSQITYVLSSRFTPEQGYIIDSRRGGGGYIRITRIKMDRGSALMHALHAVGDQIDSLSAQAIVNNLLEYQFIGENTAALMNGAIADHAYSIVEPSLRDMLRASILKNMLIYLVRVSEKTK